MTLDKETLEQFRNQIRGQVLSPGELGYDAARSVWNAMVNKHPVVIARCMGAADVIRAVAFARENSLLVSVKGGGHNVAGKAVCDHGLMIDLSLMKTVHINAANRIARVDPGTTWADFNQEAQAFGLATTGGVVSHTGVAGLALGGGLGWLMAQHGFTCDNLLSADVVTAEGELVHASFTDSPDLFWALQGGGGNFGIVTSFEFQLHEVGPIVYGGALFWPHSETREVLQFYREFSDGAPDKLTAFAGLLHSPDGIPLVGIFASWFGELQDGEAKMASLRKFKAPVMDLMGPIPYTQLNMIFDAAAPFGIQRYWKSGFVQDLNDGLIEKLIAHTSPMPSVISTVLLFHVHGKPTRKNTGETAFRLREKVWDIDIIAQWKEDREAKMNIDWARNFWKNVAPHTKGVYVNHIDDDEDNARVRSAYGENYERLQRLKRKYDPNNFFRMNNNIIPLGTP